MSSSIGRSESISCLLDPIPMEGTLLLIGRCVHGRINCSLGVVFFTSSTLVKLLVNYKPRSGLLVLSNVLEKVVVSFWTTFKETVSLRCPFQVLELITTQKRHLLQLVIISELQMMDWFLCWFCWTSVRFLYC